MHQPIAPMRSFFTLGCDCRNSKAACRSRLARSSGTPRMISCASSGVVATFAAIEIDGQRHVALVGQLRGLLFHPVVQSPPFVNDDERGKRAFARGRVENALARFRRRFCRRRLAFGGEGGNAGQQQDSKRCKRIFFMALSSCRLIGRRIFLREGRRNYNCSSM